MVLTGLVVSMGTPPFSGPRKNLNLPGCAEHLLKGLGAPSDGGVRLPRLLDEPDGEYDQLLGVPSDEGLRLARMVSVSLKVRAGGINSSWPTSPGGVPDRLLLRATIVSLWDKEEILLWSGDPAGLLQFFPRESPSDLGVDTLSESLGSTLLIKTDGSVVWFTGGVIHVKHAVRA